MITIDTINNLYNSFATAPQLFEDRGLGLLMDLAFDTDHVDFDGDSLVFNGIESDSPLHSIEIERFHGARDLGSHIAAVLPNSIIFINKADGSASLHIKD